MGRVHEVISTELAAWIERQPVFFVATAPLSPDGHVNASPKGLDSLRIVGPTQVAYLDLTGSGAETIAHLRENGRIVLMFCAFEGPPKIVRLYGRGTVVTHRSRDWSDWRDRFPDLSAPRSIIVVDVDRVSDSCGFGVPRMALSGERTELVRWAKGKGADELTRYRRKQNSTSIDGLAALTEDET